MQLLWYAWLWHFLENQRNPYQRWIWVILHKLLFNILYFIKCMLNIDRNSVMWSHINAILSHPIQSLNLSFHLAFNRLLKITVVSLHLLSLYKDLGNSLAWIRQRGGVCRMLRRSATMTQWSLNWMLSSSPSRCPLTTQANHKSLWESHYQHHSVPIPEHYHSWRWQTHSCQQLSCKGWDFKANWTFASR